MHLIKWSTFLITTHFDYDYTHSKYLSTIFAFNNHAYPNRNTNKSFVKD